MSGFWAVIAASWTEEELRALDQVWAAVKATHPLGWVTA